MMTKVTMMRTKRSKTAMMEATLRAEEVESATLVPAFVASGVLAS